MYSFSVVKWLVLKARVSDLDRPYSKVLESEAGGN